MNNNQLVKVNQSLIPNDVIELISILTSGEKKAYLVGGCVRDLIIGETPHDYDICSEMLPNEASNLLNEHEISYFNSGLDFGTITAQLNGNKYEITTFRKETGYEDSRHPDNIEYVKDIHEDLKRRDFTINAMAYNPLTEELIDDFGGIDDLNNKVIRSVGNADDRFKEDALRIIRALRFSIKFQFEIESTTYAAMKNNCGLLSKVSKERVTAEFGKILTCGKPVTDKFLQCRWLIKLIVPGIDVCFDFNQHNKYHKHDIYTHILAVVDGCKTDKVEIKMAALLHDIGKPSTATFDDEGWLHFYGHPKVSYAMACEILSRYFRFTKEQFNKITALVLYHDMDLIATKPSVKRAINKFDAITNDGVETLKDWFILKQADMDDHVFPEGKFKYKIDINGIKCVLSSILDEQSAFTLKDLNINGSIIMKELGLKPSRQIGFVLQTLLDEVIDEKVENDTDKLLARARKLI